MLRQFFLKREQAGFTCASSASDEVMRTSSSAERSSLVLMRALPRSLSIAIWLSRSRFSRVSVSMA